MRPSLKQMFNLRSLAIAGTVAAGTIMGAIFNGGHYEFSKNDNESLDEQAELYKEVLGLIAQNAILNPDIAQLNLKAIQDMLQQLDPHSRYTPPQKGKSGRATKPDTISVDSGAIGIVLKGGQEYAPVVISEILPYAPAALAGLQKNDVITTINGEDAQKMGRAKAIQTLRGKVGQPVTIGVRRGPEALSFSLIREPLLSGPLRTNPLPDGVVHIMLEAFDSGASKALKRDIDDAIAKIGEHKFRGLILDLRGNPGGLVSEAVKVADLFLHHGVITRYQEKNQTTTYHARQGDILGGKPLMILIDSGSASASELVAGALQDHERATILGTQSFGKGTGQINMRLSNGGKIAITHALYYLPSGYSVQQIGVTPNVRFESHGQPFVAFRKVGTTESQRPRSIPNPNKADMPKRSAQESCRPSPSASQAFPIPGPFHYERDKPDFLLLCAYERLNTAKSNARYTLTAPAP